MKSRKRWRTSTTGERLIGLFLFGLLLFMPPLIGVFDKAHLVDGIPMLYLYLFLTWAMLIALLALIVERAPSDDDLGEGEQALGLNADQLSGHPVDTGVLPDHGKKTPPKGTRRGKARGDSVA